MKRTREQIKAEMMKKYEQELDELLDWQKKQESRIRQNLRMSYYPVGKGSVEKW